MPRAQESGAVCAFCCVLAAAARAGWPLHIFWTLERDGSGALVDVRSPQEYSGELISMPNYPQEGAQRGGHIPGARNIPHREMANRLAEIEQQEPAIRDMIARAREVSSEDLLKMHGRLQMAEPGSEVLSSTPDEPFVSMPVDPFAGEQAGGHRRVLALAPPVDRLRGARAHRPFAAPPPAEARRGPARRRAG